MKIVSKILQNRNFILIAALVIAFASPGAAPYFKEYTLYLLSIVMTFSISGISFKIFNDYKSVLKTSAISIFLNYFIHGIVVMSLAYLFFDDKNIILGFAVIAATPPGVAVIPFTFSFKGDLNFAFKGILGTYLASIILTPLIIEIFASGSNISPTEIIYTIIKVIVVPLILSRFLRHPKIFETVEKHRGKVIDWGFALIIYTAVALNKQLIFNEFYIVAKTSLILFIALFGAGFLFNFLLKNKISKELLVSQNLMLTIKSSGFAIATALTLFGEESALPSAIMSIMVLLYLLFLGIIFDIKKLNTKHKKEILITADKK